MRVVRPGPSRRRKVEKQIETKSGKSIIQKERSMDKTLRSKQAPEELQFADAKRIEERKRKPCRAEYRRNRNLALTDRKSRSGLKPPPATGASTGRR